MQSCAAFCNVEMWLCLCYTDSVCALSEHASVDQPGQLRAGSAQSCVIRSINECLNPRIFA